MSHAYQALLLIGPPGSGKSTQGKILAALPGLHYWSAGEVLRAVDPQSDQGRMIQRTLARGELIPDELAVSLCVADLEARVLAGTYRPATDLLVLDGIPRTVRQAALLDEHVVVIKVFHLVCTDSEQLVQRLRRRMAEQGRADDADEHVIRLRLEIYQGETAPVLDYYGAECIANIDALRAPAEVFHHILHRVIPLLKRRRAVPPDRR
jgi:adenylate kinase